MLIDSSRFWPRKRICAMAKAHSAARDRRDDHGAEREDRAVLEPGEELAAVQRLAEVANVSGHGRPERVVEVLLVAS